VSKEKEKKDKKEVIEKKKCLDEMEDLRNDKWFQARATGIKR
jgi:hypothetical protein